MRRKKQVVGTLGAPAADDVVAFFELGEEGGDLVGIVLEVAVHGEDVVALGVIEPGGEGRGLTEVATELDDEDAAVDGGDLFEEAIGSVAGTIVDKDQFEGLADLFHDGLEAIVESCDVLLFVMERNDDGIFRHALMILLWRCFPDRGNNGVFGFPLSSANGPMGMMLNEIGALKGNFLVCLMQFRGQTFRNDFDRNGAEKPGICNRTTTRSGASKRSPSKLACQNMSRVRTELVARLRSRH